MENLTASEATGRWHLYTFYKAECMRANVFPLGFQAWEKDGMPQRPEETSAILGESFVGFASSDPSAERKATPIFSGFLRYFPLAVAAAARLSKMGNDKHNPGEPLHWSRGKSNDHGDCLVRHQMDFDKIDPETGEYHAVAVLWRAAAQLELLEEKRVQASHRSD